MPPVNAENVDMKPRSLDEENEEENEKIVRETRHFDGSVKLRNKNIAAMEQDFLYHLALGSGTHDLQKMFGDVKFVCMGGTAKRMEDFAHFMMGEIGLELPTGSQLLDISANSLRYSLYKVGPVLSISHGVGVTSLGVVLHEIIKLMYHAKCKDPTFIRIGTSGGVGIEGGTVVVSDGAVDERLRETYEMTSLGKAVFRPAILCNKLALELKSMADPEKDGFKTVTGKTMCAYDFYEGQGRLDGAFCDHTEQDKMDYLKRLQEIGVVNIEMEATMFAGLTRYAGIKAAICCVALLNRLNGDQVTTPKQIMHEWQKRPQIIISRFIRNRLNIKI